MKNNNIITKQMKNKTEKIIEFIYSRILIPVMILILLVMAYKVVLKGERLSIQTDKITEEEYIGEHSCWADINVDSEEKTLHLQINSDYGNWSYYWGSCGESGYEFLKNLNKEYVAVKFGESQEFDFYKTIEEMKEIVEEQSENKDQERFLIKQLNNMHFTISANEFTSQLMYDSQFEELMGLFEGGPDIVTDISQRFNNFWEKLWTPFVKYLKKDNDN